MYAVGSTWKKGQLRHEQIPLSAQAPSVGLLSGEVGRVGTILVFIYFCEAHVVEDICNVPLLWW